MHDYARASSNATCLKPLDRAAAGRRFLKVRHEFSPAKKSLLSLGPLITNIQTAMACRSTRIFEPAAEYSKSNRRTPGKIRESSNLAITGKVFEIVSVPHDRMPIVHVESLNGFRIEV